MRAFYLVGFAACLAAASSLSVQAAPSAEVYGSPPSLSDVSVSPDGAYLAMVVPQGDTGGVRIQKIGGASCIFAGGKVKVRDVFWGNAQRVVVRISFTHYFDPARKSPEYTQEIYRYVSVDTGCQNMHELLGDHKNIGSVTGFQFIGRAPDGQHLLFAMLNLKMPMQFEDTHIKAREMTSLDVYSVDVATGKSERYEQGTPRTDEWFADASGRLPLRIERDAQSGRRTVLARIGESRDWQLVYDSDASDDAHELYFVGVGNRPDTAYVSTYNGGDKIGIYEFDLKTKSLGQKVFQHARVDADDLLRDNYSQRVVGVAYTDDLPSAQYFDRGYAQMQADLAATFTQDSVQVASVTSDGKKFVAYVEGPENPGGAYHFVDMTVPEMTKISSRYASLGAGDISAVKSFSYQARDGRTIPAYLTLPAGSSGKNVPLVVHPHGGPASRDSARFDAWVQFLTSRGYAVFQPQFRGSAGFGAAHLAAGHFKWGREMQDDITDGVNQLIAKGTVDASKICIFGWSYGGYAAMAGVAFTPDLYKCGIAGAGVSDLLLLVGDVKRESDFVYLGGKSWREIVGDPIVDRDRLIATSPIKYVAQIKAPLLLLHGRDDTVVPFRQSSLMADAMKAAGKSVEFVPLEGDHNLTSARMSKRVLQEVEAFLAKHLR